MEYSQEELSEAKRQIESTVHKLRESSKTMEAKPNADKLKPQITLAKRRIKALEIATSLIDEKLDSSMQDEKTDNYQQMHHDLQAEYAQVCEQMGELKEKGLEKKVTFKTLMARKLTLREMLNTYEKYEDYLRIVVVAYNDELRFYENCEFVKADDASPMFITSLWR